MTMTSELQDITNDPGHRTLCRLLSRHPNLPDYVKKSALTDHADLRNVQDRFFALPAERKFPCHTKAATVLSHLFWVNQRDKAAPNVRKQVDGQFARLADFWDNAADLKQSEKLVPAKDVVTPTKMALNDKCILHVHNYQTGDFEYLLPVDDRRSAKAAAEHLVAHASGYPLPARMKAAKRLLDTNLLNGVDEQLVDKIETMSGLHPAFPFDIAVRLNDRASVYSARSDEKAAGLLRKAASALLSGDLPPSAELSEKVANMVDALDIVHSLGRYDDLLYPPEYIAYDPSVYKMAAQLRSTVVRFTDGQIWKLADLVNAGRPPYEVAEPGLADELAHTQNPLDIDPAKVAEVLPALPRPLANRLTESLKAAGVAPITHDHVPGRGARRLQKLVERTRAPEELLSV